jgi:uncharacterized damage-inducible protein DinB
MMTIALTADDFLEYTAWQRDTWREWFRTHPEALRLSAGPHGDGRFATVGDLVKHVFGAEQRYVQRLRDEPLSDLGDVPSDDVDALFAAGTRARLALSELIGTFPSDAWDLPRAFVILGHHVTATPKKIVMHVLLHEVRHWAQIATLCRLNGMAIGFQDFLASPIFGRSL